MPEEKELTAEKEAEVAVEESHDEMLPTEIDLVPLQKETDEALKDIVSANSVEELKDFTARFNLNMAKKNAVRMAKLQNLLDAVNDQAISRFENQPGEFSNKEVLDYMKVVQEQINSSQQALDTVGDAPMIQINNQKNEVNINVEHPALSSRESKERVLGAVQALIQNLVQHPQDDTQPEEEEVQDEELYNSDEENDIDGE